jgi:hypothetical protein
MTEFSKTLFASILVLLIPLELHAEIYRWVDADGKVHFSEQAPVEQSAEEITEKLDKVGNFFEFAEVVDVGRYKPPADYEAADVEVKIELVDYKLRPGEYRKIRDTVSGIYEAYSRWFGWPQKPGRPVVIRIFGKFDAFEQHQKDKNYGHSTTRSHYSATRGEVVMLGTEFKLATLGVLFHEASHAILAMKFKSAPNWINEGLAECFESIEVNNKKIHLRRNPLWLEKVKHKLREGSLQPIEQYLGVSNKQWRESSIRVENTHYMVAWSIMRSLLSSQQGIDTLRTVFSTMQSKGWWKEGQLVVIFADAYPGGTKKLDRDWRKWIRSPSSS